MNTREPIKPARLTFMGASFCVLVAVLSAIGFLYVVTGGISQLHDYLNRPAELTPGELVDRAMSIPGVIVLTPHRSLNDVGVVSFIPPDDGVLAYLKSPAIAVHTKTGWCLWQLGANQGLKLENERCFSDANNTFCTTPLLSEYFQLNTVYDAFTKCVTEGNR